jgi:hypothetical protein
MFAKFFISGKGNFGGEIGRNFPEGRGRSQMSVVRKMLGLEWRCDVSLRV